MKVILLAAGRGSRMEHLTNKRPKCFLEFNGRKLIDWQVTALRNNGISDITVVCGYMSSAFDELPYKLDLIVNKRWHETNMVYSLMCARHIIESGNDILISYSDIVYTKDVIKKIIDTDGDIAVTIDKNWRNLWSIRNDNPLDDAESLSISEAMEITDIGQKVDDIELIQAQYIGLIKLSARGAKILIDFIDKALPDTEWLSGATLDNAFMTDLLQALIHAGYPIKASPIHGGWLEFDTPGDMDAYNQLIQNGTIQDYINLAE